MHVVPVGVGVRVRRCECTLKLRACAHVWRVATCTMAAHVCLCKHTLTEEQGAGTTACSHAQTD